MPIVAYTTFAKLLGISSLAKVKYLIGKHMHGYYYKILGWQKYPTVFLFDSLIIGTSVTDVPLKTSRELTSGCAYGHVDTFVWP